MPRRRLSAMSHPTDRLVGYSPSIRALRAQIRRLVAFDTLGNPSVPTLVTPRGNWHRERAGGADHPR